MQEIKHFIKTHPHMWWGLYLPVYLILYFVVEHVVTDNYWATQTAIDDYIPFCEYFVIPYDSWGILLFILGVFFIVKDPESFRRYMWFIAIAYTTATLFCFLVPNGQDLRPAELPRQNICTWILQMTWAAANHANVFPSVPVLGGVAAVTSVWETPGLRKSGWRWFAAVYGLVIIASTLLVKQHTILDVAAAIPWGMLSYLIVYRVIGRRRNMLPQASPQGE